MYFLNIFYRNTLRCFKPLLPNRCLLAPGWLQPQPEKGRARGSRLDTTGAASASRRLYLGLRRIYCPDPAPRQREGNAAPPAAPRVVTAADSPREPAPSPSPSAAGAPGAPPAAGPARGGERDRAGPEGPPRLRGDAAALTAAGRGLRLREGGREQRHRAPRRRSGGGPGACAARGPGWAGPDVSELPRGGGVAMAGE